MWRPDPAKRVQVRLHDRGADEDVAWAEDCGPAPGPPGTRYVRLGSIPLLHAKPTYGDVIAVQPAADGTPSWDRAGLPHERIRDLLIEDGGRWAMILDCELLDTSAAPDLVFRVLEGVCEVADIATRTSRLPEPGLPGRVYLAAPAALGVGHVLAYLEGRALPLSLSLVHPRGEDDDDG